MTVLGLYGTAAVSCFARARHSRAFGLLAALLLTAGGLGGSPAPSGTRPSPTWASSPSRTRRTPSPPSSNSSRASRCSCSSPGAAPRRRARTVAPTRAPAPPYPTPPGW
ncbi:hypothetical protein O1L60_25235 [Streptomyces diastatochromogenes]|nr:hypothetical protein [Streptomyces diastatochromogenes]